MFVETPAKAEEVVAKPKVKMTMSVLVISGVVSVAIGFVILGIAWCFGSHQLHTTMVALRPDLSMIGLGTLLGIPFFFFGHLLKGLCIRLGIEGESTADLLAPEPVHKSLIGAASTGFSEEFLFRGVILPLIGSFLGPVLSSAIFAGAHFSGKKSLPYVARTFVYGCIFAAMFVLSGSLWVGIMAHFVNNFASYIALSLEHSRSR